MKTLCKGQFRIYWDSLDAVRFAGPRGSGTSPSVRWGRHRLGSPGGGRSGWGGSWGMGTLLWAGASPARERSGGLGGDRAGWVETRRGPPAGKARTPGPAPPPHLHVGHEALLDSPAAFIDLFQELQFIVITAAHGVDKSGENSRLRFEEPLPRCPADRNTNFRNSTRRRGQLRGRMGDG